MKKAAGIIFTIPLIFICGCASIIEGKSQEVYVNTSPPEANCSFLRHGETLGNIQTPGKLYLRKTKYDIDIKCNKEGYQPTTYLNHSDIDEWTFGNIIFGGVIGWGIDSAIGADNKYDSPVNLTLAPLPVTIPAITSSATPPAAAPQPMAPQAVTPQSAPQPAVMQQPAPASVQPTPYSAPPANESGERMLGNPR